MQIISPVRYYSNNTWEDDFCKDYRYDADVDTVRWHRPCTHAAVKKILKTDVGFILYINYCGVNMRSCSFINY